MAPAPPGLLPGLGGAAAVVQVTGASGAPNLPIEWDSSGSSQSFTLTTPTTPTRSGSRSVRSSTGSDVWQAQINLQWTNDSRPPWPLPQTSPALASASSSTARSATPLRSASSLEGWGRCPRRPVSTRRSGVRSAPPRDRSWRAGSERGSSRAADLATVASIPPLTPGALDFAVPSLSITGAPAGAVLHGDSIRLARRQVEGLLRTPTRGRRMVRRSLRPRPSLTSPGSETRPTASP